MVRGCMVYTERTKTAQLQAASAVQQNQTAYTTSVANENLL